MKKLVPVIILLTLVLVSCTTINSFTEENPYVASIGTDGDYIFTTTRNILGLNKIKITRISGCYDPDTGVVYGAVEGGFPRPLFNAAMKVSKSIERFKIGSFKAWYDKDNKMYYYCPSRGIVLFSNSDLEKVYMETYVNRVGFADSISLEKMLNAEIGFFVKKPDTVPDVGFNIPQSTIEKFDKVCAAIDGEVLDVDFTLSNENLASAFFKLIKASVIGKMILKGEKPDYTLLKEQITQEGNSVYLNEITLTKEEQDKIINSII